MSPTGTSVVDETSKPELNVRRSHYDANYGNFLTDVYEQVRRDAFDEDIGQNSWLTAMEQDTFRQMVEPFSW